MLSEQNLLQVANFDATIANGLRANLGGGVDALSAASAIDLTKYLTELSVDGTKAYTIAAPTQIGDRKRILCVSATNTPLGTVTVTSPDTTTGFVTPTTIVFTAVGQAIELYATAALKWRIRKQTQRAGVQTLVVGTTLTAGLVMAHTYALSVTGTVNSTGATKAIPDGLFPGDSCFVICTTASTLPVGSIDFNGVTIAGAAVTHITGVSTTTVIVSLSWNGAAWLVPTSANVTIN